MVYLKRWILNVLIAIEQLVMAICCGDPDETWSSLSWRIHLHFGIDFPYKIIDFIFWDGHCRECFEPDEGGNALWSIYSSRKEK